MIVSGSLQVPIPLSAEAGDEGGGDDGLAGGLVPVR
jgi:hypothetical protein